MINLGKIRRFAEIHRQGTDKKGSKTGNALGNAIDCVNFAHFRNQVNNNNKNMLRNLFTIT